MSALKQLSLVINKGETLGIVGESGCGKSTLGKALLRLQSISSGTVLYEGVDLHQLSSCAFKPYRKKMQMVFQDPYSSLNPRMRVCDIIGEPFAIHGKCEDKSIRESVEELLRLVQLDESYYYAYPDSLSGGQRQRVGIARAIALSPELLFCDEPVSALDVNHQAGIVHLLQDLQKKLGLTCLFVSHDLSIVRYIADRIAVMYLGEVVEIASASLLSKSSRHPYTQGLFSSIAVPDPKVERKKIRIIVKGDLPDPYHPPLGCPYHPRCPKATELCQRVTPPVIDCGSGHHVRCHFAKS